MEQDKKLNLYLREIQGILALSYIGLVLIGMIVDFVYYSYFNINIFDYSEILDFLTAPFKKVQTLLLFTLTIIITFIAHKADRYFAKKRPKLYSITNFGFNKKSWFSIYRKISYALVFITLLILYLNLFAERRRDFLYKTKEYKMKVIFSSEKKIFLEGNQIGANSKYIFLLDKKKKLHIIPFTSQVESIRFR